MKKVILIGPYPPPIGGNSVHIKRLKDELDRSNIDCAVLDIYGSSKAVHAEGVIRFRYSGFFTFISIIWYLWKNESQLVHIHVAALDKFIYLGAFMLFPIKSSTTKVLTIHSGGFVEKYTKFSSFKQWLTRKLVGSFDRIITVNQEQKGLLIGEGINEKNITVIPAYLPPIVEPDESLDEVISALKTSGRKVIITSGYGWSLYGFDIIIKALLSSDLIDKVSLLICTYSAYDEAYMLPIEEIANDHPCIHIVKELSAERFSYVLQKCDAYIRATDQDGDAVAIREANYFGLPVVASDVVKRPDYCILFNLNDLDGLKDAINNSISGGTEVGAVDSDNTGNYERLLEVYNLS